MDYKCKEVHHEEKRDFIVGGGFVSKRHDN